MLTKKHLGIFAVFPALLIGTDDVAALENGTSGYPRGVVTVMSGAVGSRGETYLYS